jgi:hypothetical protein
MYGYLRDATLAALPAPCRAEERLETLAHLVYVGAPELLLGSTASAGDFLDRPPGGDLRYARTRAMESS